jgi:glycosyltransferase involved in cell wall biosynthesis/transposase
MSHSAKIGLTPALQDELDRRANSRTTAARAVERAKIILWSAAGKAKQEIAEQPGIARQTVRRWEKRFVKEGTKGLEEAPQSGRPRRIGPEQIAQIVHKTTQETPADSTHWSTRSMALVVKVSASSVGRIWRSAKLKVHRVRTFRLSNDRQFAEKTDAVVQLYLNPPPDSVVSSAPHNGSDAVGGQFTGINFVGYLRSEMGVGESVRCAVRAARAARLPTAIKTVDFNGPYRREDGSIGDEDREHPHSVNVFHVNADEVGTIMARLGAEFSRGKRNIGYWAWELEEFPVRWLSSFRFFDEIWTPSSFCQTAIASKARVPVIRIPHAIQSEPISSAGRESFSIPCGRFVFLTVFDLLSVAERKNPAGVIKAFRLAFGASSQCHLVLKINHAAQRPGEIAAIREATAGMPVTILDRPMSREDLNALICCCDCLVSLHRSEGFGLTIAEAMYLGKPVIATGYSGNLDFTNPGNSFLVNYRMVPVPKGCEPYEAGLLWAEPSIEHASAQMRLVVENSDVRQALAEKGAEWVRTQLAPEAVGSLMRERLELAFSGFHGRPLSRGAAC